MRHLGNAIGIGHPAYRPRRRAAIAWRSAVGLANARRCALRGVRRAFPVTCKVLCKLALLLTFLATPGDFASVDEATGKKVAEECVVAQTIAEARSTRTAAPRGTALVVHPAPLAARQCLAAVESHKGHVLFNGLRAPLRC